MAHEWADRPRLYLKDDNPALTKSYDTFGRFDGWIMDVEIHEWCDKFLSAYTYNKVSLLMRFVDEDEMMLFKLTWCGK